MTTQLKFIVLTMMAAVALTLPADAAPNSANHVVVLISIDGLAGFYFEDPKAAMPTLRKLADEGAQAPLMRASTPTVTWPNHTTLVTGVNPARHGVVGNNYFDRVGGTNVALIADPVFTKEELVKVPTIYDLAKAKGLKTLAIRWPATRAARSLDWTIPDMKPTESIRQFSTPALLTECAAAGLPMLDGFETNHSGDEYCAKVFIHMLKQHQPDLALFHIIDVDHTQHEHGPRTPEAYAAIGAADRQVREVWETLQKEFPGRATLIVTSDHGFSPVTRTVLPNVILRKAGLLAEGKAVKTNPVAVVTQGGSAFIYIRDEARRTEIAAQVRAAFKDVSGVSKVIGPDEFKEYGVANPQMDPKAPDLIAFADEGCAFGKTTAGDAAFKDKTEVDGSHGHDSNLPHLHATFLAWGAGIQAGAKLPRISNTDVAPTIAYLMKLDLPQPDGRVLSEFLAE